jgi:hypothetical protein
METYCFERRGSAALQAGHVCGYDERCRSENYSSEVLERTFSVFRIRRVARMLVMMVIAVVVVNARLDVVLVAVVLVSFVLVLVLVPWNDPVRAMRVILLMAQVVRERREEKAEREKDQTGDADGTYSSGTGQRVPCRAASADQGTATVKSEQTQVGARGGIYTNSRTERIGDSRESYAECRAQGIDSIPNDGSVHAFAILGPSVTADGGSAVPHRRLARTCDTPSLTLALSPGTTIAPSLLRPASG